MAKHGDVKANFEDLPEMKETVLRMLDDALATLEKVETEADIRLEDQKRRLHYARELVAKSDPSQIPSNMSIDSDIRNYFADFVQMRDGSNQVEQLKHQSKPAGPRSWTTFELKGEQLRNAMELIRGSRNIFEAAKAVQELLDLFLAAYERAQQKRKEQLKPKVAAMKEIRLAAVRADKLSDAERNPDLVAQPLRELERTIEMIGDQRGADFWTPRQYRQYMKTVCNDAYGLVRQYGFEDQLQQEESRAKAATQMQTLRVGEMTERRSLLSRLFRKKKK